MAIELVDRECYWCGKNFKGRAYQEYCSGSCSDKCYYHYKKKNRKKPLRIKKCDICGKDFTPIRNNVKRCSEVCRSIWKRDFSVDRWDQRKKKNLENAKPRLCAVCQEVYTSSNSVRKTCSRECSVIYGKYRWRKDNGKSWGGRQHQKANEVEANYDALLPKCDLLVPYRPRLIPLPEHDAITVGKINIKDSEDIKKATEIFKQKGGKIRKFSASPIINFNKDAYPLKDDGLHNDEEYIDELEGKVRPY